MQNDAATADEPLLGNSVNYGTTEKDLLASGDQAGVERADAINRVWTSSAFVWAYCFIFLNFFVNSLQQQTTSNLLPYVVSDFSAHSLIPAIGITSFILSGVLKLPVAKMIDAWGRPQGFAVMTALATLGLVLMSLCKDVKTYAAAKILHGVGFSGFTYILEIIVADTSSLKNRSLALSFADSPYIATTFAGPVAAQWFLQYSSWRTAFVSFAVVMPLTAVSVYVILESNARKAQRLGELKAVKSHRTWSENFLYFTMEFDAVGVILLGMGFSLLLLPFSLAGSAGSKWSSPGIIAMVVLGSILSVVLLLYERYYAHKPFLPFQLLLSGDVLGACILSTTLSIAYFSWDGYYTSYLQVVHQLSVSEAGYVDNVYSIGSCLWAIVVGWLIKATDRFRWLAWIAVPIQLLGGASMVVFRQPYTPIAYVIICQVLIAIGGGTLVVTGRMAVMSIAKHGEVASLLALLGLSSAMGAGVGSSVSGAIWSNTVHAELLRLLPDDAKDMAKEIYESLELQLSYPVGNPVREAVMLAYGTAQRRMVVAGMAVLLVAIPAVAVWRDVRVSVLQQVQGRVL
ncbi:siderophore iron transporter mirB [Chaetomium strumarium]|uniref:Siderophore iron transporter mirB n=1 Tax=Chaetomium strumarium TaxID=1170767 RepID=A0AAJ0GX70_9PEZI|nr:siderophore iron transporter mirB [Chaetomium strumarium]